MKSSFWHVFAVWILILLFSTSIVLKKINHSDPPVILCWATGFYFPEMLNIFLWHKSSQRKDDISYKTLFNVLQCYRADSCEVFLLFSIHKISVSTITSLLRKSLKRENWKHVQFYTYSILYLKQNCCSRLPL